MSWWIVHEIKKRMTVPTADVSTNVNERDAIGNKTDAAVTTVGTTKSLMAHIKGIMGFHTIAVADAATNAQMRDAVGNKEDAAVLTATTDKTLMAYSKGNLALSRGTITGTIVEDLATATANVLQVEPGINSNFGSWFAKDASASADSWICGFNVTPTTAFNPATVDVDYVIEIGTGGAGAEVTKIHVSFKVYATAALVTASEFMIQPIIFTLPKLIKVASSTRIAVRASKSTAGTGTYLFVGLQMYQNLE